MNALWMAWLLPMTAGVAFALTFASAPRRGRIFAVLGYGMVFGLLLAAAAAAFAGRADTTQAWLHGAPWLIAFTVLAAVAAAWRLWRASARAPLRLPPEIFPKVQKWKLLLLVAACASLLLRGWVIAREILLRPTFPWDAWDAWAVKSKTWFLLGHYAPFVAMPRWLSHPSGELFTGPAWNYPSTLAWMQIWFASAVGAWIEPLVNLPWLALWIGLLLGHYGQWRSLGLRRSYALAFVYVLGSLPLLDAHVALAGYADLWIATLLGFAVLAWMRWLEQRDIGQLSLAVICALTLPLIKNEGGVWAVCLFAVMVLAAIPLRWRWRVVFGTAAGSVAFIALGGLRIPFAVLSWLRSGAHAIESPLAGTQALHWHAAAFAGIERSLFLQPNWHLLWWLTPLLVIGRWRSLRSNDSLTLLGVLISTCLGLLLFLFLFTDAAQWAESYTAVNRLVLHITPAVVTLLALLLRVDGKGPVPTDTARVSDPLPASS